MSALRRCASGLSSSLGTSTPLDLHHLYHIFRYACSTFAANLSLLQRELTAVLARIEARIFARASGFAVRAEAFETYSSGFKAVKNSSPKRVNMLRPTWDI